MVKSGTLYGIGVGPGDPELMTVKAMRTIAEARVVAFFCKRGKLGNAHAIAAPYLHREAEQLPLAYPYTTEISARHPDYLRALRAFYDESAERLAAVLQDGRDVSVLCEGDPLLYGSYIYLHDRLARAFRTVVIPGIASYAGCAARAGAPLVSANRRFSVVPGTLPEAALEDKLRGDDAAAVIKLGSNFGKVRRVIERLGKLAGALYFEHGTSEREVAMPLSDKQGERSPYFSLILLPSHDAERMAPRRTEAGAP